MEKVNVLSYIMKRLSPEQREELAMRAGTSVGYLYQLAGGHRENPRARLALGLVLGVEDLRESGVPIPALTVTDLAYPIVSHSKSCR